MSVSPIKERDIFYDYYAQLSNTLGVDVHNLLPGFVAERIINTNDRAVIEHIVSPVDKAGKLLGYIAGPLEAGSKDGFVKMLNIMVACGNIETNELAYRIMDVSGIPYTEPATEVSSPSTVGIAGRLASRSKPELNLLVDKVMPLVADKWDKIGALLIPEKNRNFLSICRQNTQSTEDRCQAMLEEWLNSDSNASWNRLIDALRSKAVRKDAIADQLVKELNLCESVYSTSSRTVEPFSPSGAGAGNGLTSPQQSISRPKRQQQEQEQEDSANKKVEIKPQTAPTVDCGKGLVPHSVYADVKCAVCRIRAPQFTGTGFIGYMKLGTEYCTVLVTNNHVIPTQEDAMGSIIIFENVMSDHSCHVKGFHLFLKEDNAFVSNPADELDYSIIKVNEDNFVDAKTKTKFEITPIMLTNPAPIKHQDQVYVIQHPQGGQLAFSSSESFVLRPLLVYECSTDSGSSGSPVLKEMNGTLVIVALHRGGAPEFNCGTLISAIQSHMNGQPVPPLPSKKQVNAALTKRTTYVAAM